MGQMLMRDISSVVNKENRKIVLGVGLNAIGGGMTLSLLMVYLHQMRGFSIGFAGFVMALGACVSLLVGGPIGYLTDHVGPRKVMIVGICAAAISCYSWSNVESKTGAIAVMIAFSISNPAVWTPQTTLLSRLTAPEDRQKVFGINFMLLNLGLGIGGLISSLIISSNSLHSFQVMYWCDGATYLFYLALVLSIRSEKAGKYIPEAHEPQGGSYRELFADRRLVLLAISGLTLMTFAYGPLQSGEAVFATEIVGLSPKWLGIIYGANTFVIVAFQPWMLRKIDGRNKYNVIMVASLIWFGSWIVMSTAPWLPLFMGGVAMSSAALIFAFAEMIWSPTNPALINEIAPEHIRGRANALLGIQWGVSGAIGPAISALLLSGSSGTLWVYSMAFGTLLPLPLFYYLKKKAS